MVAGAKRRFSATQDRLAAAVAVAFQLLITAAVAVAWLTKTISL